jgi:hypothetical protein
MLICRGPSPCIMCYAIRTAANLTEFRGTWVVLLFVIMRTSFRLYQLSVKETYMARKKNLHPFLMLYVFRATILHM